MVPVTADGIAQRLSRWVCGLHGHERYLHSERDRLSLRCAACGHESPGWTVGRPAYRQRWAGDAARHRLR